MLVRTQIFLFYIFCGSIFLGLPLVVDYALCLLIIFLYIVKEHRMPYFNNIVLLILPMFIGSINGSQNDLYLVLKDLFYLSIPVVSLATGYCLYSIITIKKLYNTLILFGIVMMLKKVVIAVMAIGITAIFNPILARYDTGFLGHPAPALALGLILAFYIFKNSSYSKRKMLILAALNLFGLYMMASRAYMLFFISFIVIYGVLIIRQKPARLISYSVVLSLSVLILLNVQSSSDSFMYKVLNSIKEVSVTDYSTEHDINFGYRGYETFMAFQTFSEGGLALKMFGGLGRLVDLKTYVPLAEGGMRFIPILHNGYLYILIKTGLAGFACYILYFVFNIIKNVKILRHSNVDLKTIGFVNLGIIISLLSSTYIIYGLFSIEMVFFSILLSYQNLFVEKNSC